MSIKVNSSFEPNGNFALAQAKHIEVSKPGNITSDLQTIISEMLSAPEISFGADNSLVTEHNFLAITRDLNAEYTLPIEIKGASSGCQISVVSCLFKDFTVETADGPFSPVLTCNGFNGINYLKFEKAITTPQDRIYKIVVSDTRGNSGFYQAPGGEILNYLLFRVTFGDLSLSSSFDTDTLDKVYSTDDTTLNYKFSTNYGVGGYRWLFYKRFSPSAAVSSPATQLSDWNYIALNSGDIIESGSLYESEETLTIFDSTVPDSARLGQHSLIVYAGWSDKQDAVSAATGNCFAGLLSQASTHSIIVLPPNSASITYLSNLQKSFYSKDYLTVDLLPKTNIVVALETANSLKAVCSLYKVISSEPFQVEELTDFRRTYVCTPTKKFTYSARQTLAEHINAATTFVWGTKCVLSTAPEEEINRAEVYYSSTFTVQLSETSNYRTEDLLFNFVAEEGNIEEDTNLNCMVWKAEQNSQSTMQYQFALHNFNPALMGVQIEQVQDQQTSADQPVVVIRDTGVGILSRRQAARDSWKPYSPWQALSGGGATGLTIETYYRTEAGGSPYSNALTITGTNNNEAYSHLCAVGLQLGTDSAYIGGGGSSAQLPLLANTWQHVALVIDVRERDEITTTVLNNSGQEERVYLALLQIYINGALSKVVTVTREALSAAISGNNTSPLCLNGRCYPIDNLRAPDLQDYLQKLSAELLPENQGSCQFRFIRGYNAPLTADEIYNNYKNSVHQDLYEKLDTKEKSVLPKIYFCPISITDSKEHFSTLNRELTEWELNAYKSLELREKSWNPRNKDLETTTDSKELEKIKQNLLISDLNQVSEKYPTSAMKQAAKNTLTSCIVYCDWGGKGNSGDFEIFDDVEVSLQGTSTLKYPVKNYKIKTYKTDTNGNAGQGERSKKKFIPKPAENSWKTDSAVYTLKCDYMEQSHRNNTPTACFYEERLLPGVLDFAVSHSIGSVKGTERRKKQSPATRYHNDSNHSIFRDAIAGFPCELYYTDELRILTSENCNRANSDILPNANTSGIKLLGTYMFNIDKEGDQFGFEIDTADLESEVNQYKSGEVSTSYFRTELLAADSENLDILPCSSIEGSENADMDMGASGFQPYEGLYISQLQSIFENCPSDKTPLCRITSEGTPKTDTYSTAKQLWLALFTEEDPKADTVTKIEYCYCTETDRDNEETLSFIELTMTPKTYFDCLGKSREDYYSETLEPRFSYMDEDNEEYFEKTFKPIVDAISWVYRNAENSSTFKTDFTKYFSYEYCLAHYLQLMMFTQVDNASKNTMYDSWGGVVYPRPYDMDTQMGLSNTGEDSKAIDSEMHVTLSPLSVALNKLELPDGKIRDKYAVENWGTEAVENAARYKDTYAAQSALWRCFGEYFKTDIADAYKYLRRQGIYSVDTICNFVDSLTYDKISAKSYNKDAELKYFPVLSDWAQVIAGDRRNRYRQYLTERMIYLDSLFDYTETDSLNTSIMLRSNTTASEDSPFELVIQVHSPQYMRLSQGSGAASYVFYASPTDTYNNGESKGTLVRFPLKSGNKEITLSGAGNIKALPNLKSLDLTLANLGNASRLTELDLSGSTYLAKLSIGSPLLTELDLSGIGTSVKTLSNDAEINLANCKFLKTLKLNGAKIGALTLPTNTILETLDLRNSTTPSLSLNGAANLVYNSNPSSYAPVEGLCLTNSTAFSKISLINCPNIDLSDFSAFPNLTTLTIRECPLIESINLKLLKKLETLEFDSTVTSIDLTSAEWSTAVLNFSNLSNLRSLQIGSAKASANNSAIVLADNLANFELTADKSNISIIIPASKYSEHTAELSAISGLYDFTSINVKTLTLQNNEKIQKLCNLVYEGNLYRFFYQCISLNTISDCYFTASTNSMIETFYKCSSLTEFSNTTWQLENVTRASSLFSYCTSLKYSSIKNLINQLTCVTDLSNMLSFALNRAWPSNFTMPTMPENPSSDQIAALLDEVFCFIPDDFFANNTQLTTLAKCFRDATTLFFVADNVFSRLNSLSDITNIFLYNKHLCYVPSNIMAQSPITRVNYAFSGCSSLGTTRLNKADTKDNEQKELPIALFDWINTKLTGFTSRLGQITTGTIFNEQKVSEITSVQGLFYGCSKFTAASGWLKKFFTELTSLIDADECFYNCAALNDDLNKIISSTSISSLRGTFAGTGITSLPETIFDNDNNSKKFTNLEYMSGIFADCTKLEGILENEFFADTPNIKNIGLVTGVPAIDGRRIALPGAFANTKLTGCTTKCLQNLTLLEDCSTLFYQGIYDTTSGVLAPANKAIKENFNVYDENGTPTMILPAEFFSKNTQLKTVAYCFNYAFIQDKTALTQISSSLFKNASNLKDISGLFLGCSAITEVEDESAEPDSVPLDVFFSHLPELIYAQELFADTSLQAEVTSHTFKFNSKLSVAKAMFMNTKLINSIPVELFNSCRNSLTDTSYMFAGCDDLTGTIGTGYAIINDPEAVTARNNEALGKIQEKHQSLHNLIDTRSSYGLALTELNELLGSTYTIDIFKRDIDRQFLDQIKQIDKIDKLSSNEFADLKEAIEAKTDISFNTAGTSYSDLYDELDSEKQKILDQYKLPHDDVIKDFSLDLDVIRDIKQKGLLSDCNYLREVQYMFAGCKHLYGPIPADMFYFSRPNNLITSIAGLFENCFGLTLDKPNSQVSNIYSNSSILAFTTKQNEISRFEHEGGGNFEEVYPDLVIIKNEDENGNYIATVGSVGGYKAEAKYFIPKDWLVGLPNLSTISKAFFHVGTVDNCRDTGRYVAHSHELGSYNEGIADEAFEQCKYSVLELPNSCFSAQKNIKDASYAFAQVQALSGTVLTNIFLANSLATLTDISYIFAGATIKSITKTFERSNGLASPLTTAEWAFCGLNITRLDTTIVETASVALAGTLPAFWNTKTIFTKLTNAKNVFGHKDSMEELVLASQRSQVPLTYWDYYVNSAVHRLSGFTTFKTGSNFKFLAGYDDSGNWTKKTSYNLGITYTKPTYS